MGDEAHPESREEIDAPATRPPSLEDLARICRDLNARGAEYVVIGGIAIILHGFPRATNDIDFLIATTPENEARVLDCISRLPDGAAKQIMPGEVADYNVVRIADEVLVDLMHSGCGITYADAIKDAVTKVVHGVPVIVASHSTLWKLKQTAREKDIQDKIFLRKWAEDHNIKLDPAPSPPPSEVPPWVEKFIAWLRRVFRRR